MTHTDEYSATGTDGEEIIVETPCFGSDTVAFIQVDEGSAYLDREAAVGVITALTDLVEKANAEAAEKARKLKAGDRVFVLTMEHRYTVVSDETADGKVDLVVTHWPKTDDRIGHLVRNHPARTFRRV